MPPTSNHENPKKKLWKSPKERTPRDKRTHDVPRQIFYTYHERFIQDLASRSNIEPSLKMNHEALQLAYGKPKGKGKLGSKWIRVPRVGCHPTSTKFIWGQPKDENTPTNIVVDTRTPWRVILKIFIVAPSDGCTSIASLRSTNATLAIMVRALYFKASRRRPSSVESPASFLWWTTANQCSLTLISTDVCLAATAVSTRSCLWGSTKEPYTISSCCSCHHAVCTWSCRPSSPSK
jgi:hypothetical protein